MDTNKEDYTIDDYINGLACIYLAYSMLKRISKLLLNLQEQMPSLDDGCEATDLTI